MCRQHRVAKAMLSDSAMQAAKVPSLTWNSVPHVELQDAFGSRRPVPCVVWTKRLSEFAATFESGMIHGLCNVHVDVSHWPGCKWNLQFGEYVSETQ